uniref:AB hydrolase-1 domain-containing protein n=1 Tax=Salix viminalis TaxID=40686 RepID=A0A6N2LN46_SALVM
MYAEIAVALAAGLLSWAYQTIKPPPPKICGSPGGPPITSPRVKLSDGRHLAYREMGRPKEEAKHKIIVIHGFDDSKNLSLPVSQETIEELSIYFLFFDRAGYGESDPYPSRSVKSEAYDIQELADQLQIGSKFYVIGMLSGASLVVPFVHYWWPSLPANISKQGFQKLCTADQRTFQVAHHTPWLFYWWMTQKWFPSLSIMAGNMNLFSPPDMEIIKKLSETPKVGQEMVRQQGIHESLHRDVLAGYAKWEFDFMDLTNPFPNNEGSFHLWQGYEDRIIPFEINRYIAEKLPWIHYHEVPDAGHLMLFKVELCEAIIRALVLG